MSFALVAAMALSTLANDCWVKFYDRHNLRGEALMYNQTGQVSDFEAVEDRRRVGNYDSVEVGPAAKLMIFERSRFRGDRMILQPGSQVMDLDDTDVDEIGSFKLKCLVQNTPDDPADEPEYEDDPVVDDPIRQDPIEQDPVEEDPVSERPSTRGDLDLYVAHLPRVRCGEFRFGSRVFVEFTEYKYGWRIKAKRRFSRSMTMDVLLNDEYFTPRDRQIVDRAVANSNFNGLNPGDYIFIEKLPAHSEVFMRLSNQLIVTTGLSHTMFSRVSQDIYDNRRITFRSCN